MKTENLLQLFSNIKNIVKVYRIYHSSGVSRTQYNIEDGALCDTS